ncbi:MAG: hypothetical protein ACJ8GW_10365 [Massilia sp.]
MKISHLVRRADELIDMGADVQSKSIKLLSPRHLLPLLPLMLCACAGSGSPSARMYAPDTTRPSANIQFALGDTNTTLNSAFFYQDAQACTNRYEVELISKKVASAPVSFNKGTPFAFTFFLQRGRSVCQGTEEFTPTEDAYKIVINSGGGQCYVTVTETNLQGDRRAVRTERRQGQTAFTQAGTWCRPKTGPSV